MRAPPSRPLATLAQAIVECRRCARLVSYCGKVGERRRAAYSGQTYWARPVPGFGDPEARLVVIGLAPGAHGANRTGRVFTGDRSGEWLYRALFRAGFANQPQSEARDDGLKLTDCWVTVCVRCAPPDNQPRPNERDACAPFLVEEIGLLRRARVLVCLGQFAWQTVQRLCSKGNATRAAFAHGAETELGAYHLLGSYHPSQQNTFTGRLTEPMLDAVFARAKEILNR